MDVIGVAGAGIAELVAPLGTAMTEAQLALAWRQVDEPILCFDGDGAGQRAALRACLRALPLLAPGKSLRIATLPPGEDPDDLVRRGGAAAFEAVLAAAQPLIEHLWRAETSGIDTSTPERRAAVRQRLKAHADAIADPSVRSLYAADFAARFEAQFMSRPPRVTWAPGRKTGFALPLAGASAALRARSTVAGTSDEALAIIAGLLTYPALGDRHGETLAALPLADTRLAALRDAILSALAIEPDLENDGLAHNLHQQGLEGAAKQVLTSNRLRFSFTRRFVPTEPPAVDKLDAEAAAALLAGHAAEMALAEAVFRAAAARDFGVLIDSITARVRIDSELAAATAQLRSSLDAEAFDRQRDLLAERVEIDAAMMRLAESLRDD